MSRPLDLLDQDSEKATKVQETSYSLCDLPDHVFEKILLSTGYDHIEKMKEVNLRFESTCSSLLIKKFFPLCSLPDNVLETVLLYTSYEHISQLRRVNRKLNTTCMSLLNRGFRAAEKYHTRCLKDVKSKLPRRESERRNHKLSRHCDILTAIETRISLLSMTFAKYIELQLCCFIPGRVIDEIFSVLRSIQADGSPPRAYEILQELRDISSMAMEYFDEKIVPGLRQHLPESPFKLGCSGDLGSSYLGRTPSLTGEYTSFLSRVTGSCQALTSVSRLKSRNIFLDSSLPATPTTSRSSSLDLSLSEPLDLSASPSLRSLQRSVSLMSRSYKKLSRKSTKMMGELRKQADQYKAALDSQNKKIVELDRRIDSQNQVISQKNARLLEQEEALSSLNRRLLETEQLVSDLRTSKVHQIRKRKIEGDVEVDGEHSKKRKMESTE